MHIFFELSFEVLRRNIQIQSLVSHQHQGIQLRSWLQASVDGWYWGIRVKQGWYACTPLSVSAVSLDDDISIVTSVVALLMTTLWHEGGYMMTSLMDIAGVTHIRTHTTSPLKTKARLNSTTHPGGRGS